MAIFPATSPTTLMGGLALGRKPAKGVNSKELKYSADLKTIMFRCLHVELFVMM